MLRRVGCSSRRRIDRDPRCCVDATEEDGFPRRTQTHESVPGGRVFKQFYMPDETTVTGVEDVSDDGESNKDSGYATPPKEKPIDVGLPESELVPLQREELGLAELVLPSKGFKERIPDREFSVAALQGYLMMHKGRPYDALECVDAWVQEEKAKKVNVVEDTVRCGSVVVYIICMFYFPRRSLERFIKIG